jgi:hypothetical protein
MVSQGEPVYRASLLKSVLSMLVEDYPGHKDEILAGVDPGRLEHIGRVSRADWVPAVTMFELNASIDEVLGREGFTKFWLTFSRTATRVPLLRNMAEGAARIFGSGQGIIKLLPRSFGMVSRDLAMLRVHEAEKGHALIEVRDFAFPESMELFAEANRASTEGALIMVGETPSAEVFELDADAGRFWMTVDW